MQVTRDDQAFTAELERKSHSSIELTRNAKGDYQWTVKLYYDGDGEHDMYDALDDLKSIDKELRATYLPQKEQLGAQI